MYLILDNLLFLDNLIFQPTVLQKLGLWFTKLKLFLELQLKQFTIFLLIYEHEFFLAMPTKVSLRLFFFLFCEYKGNGKTWFPKALEIRSFYIFIFLVSTNLGKI